MQRAAPPRRPSLRTVRNLASSRRGLRHLGVRPGEDGEELHAAAGPGDAGRDGGDGAAPRGPGPPAVDAGPARPPATATRAGDTAGYSAGPASQVTAWWKS